MSRLKEIHDYLVSIGNSEEELTQLDESSVYLSMEINGICTQESEKRKRGRVCKSSDKMYESVP